MLDIILVHNTASQYCFKIVGHNFTSLSPSLSRSFPTNSLDTAIRSTSSKSTTSTAEKTDQWLYCLLWTNTVCYSWLYDLISVASAVHTTSNIGNIWDVCKIKYDGLTAVMSSNKQFPVNRNKTQQIRDTSESYWRLQWLRFNFCWQTENSNDLQTFLPNFEKIHIK